VFVAWGSDFQPFLAGGVVLVQRSGKHPLAQSQVDHAEGGARLLRAEIAMVRSVGEYSLGFRLCRMLRLAGLGMG